jgi:hypothetical protein
METLGQARSGGRVSLSTLCPLGLPKKALGLESPVGSRTGAILRRFSLAVAPRFLWECLIIQTVSWFPVPASSNPSGRFPAMGLPACFGSRVMRPIRPDRLSSMTVHVAAGNRCTVPASRTATCYSTVSSRTLVASGLASDAAGSSSLPSL